MLLCVVVGRCLLYLLFCIVGVRVVLCVLVFAVVFARVVVVGCGVCLLACV